MSSKSVTEVMRKLGINCHYRVMSGVITQFNLSTDHFLGRAWNRKNKHHKAILLDKILIENISYPTSRLKKYLLQEGIFEKKCHKCKNTTWQDHEIPLELNHINSNRKDNRIENLELLCPNCHALTEYYCSSKSIIRFDQLKSEILDLFTNNYCKRDLKEYCKKNKISSRRCQHFLKEHNVFCNINQYGLNKRR